jgi:hypothetical protein
MADSSNEPSNLPIAGLAGIAAASLALLIAHDSPFLATRPPESAQAIYDFAAPQRVEARLWQDPFSAVESFERQEAQRMKFDAKAASLFNSTQRGTGASTPSKTTGADGPESAFETVRFGMPLAAFPGYLSELRNPGGEPASLGVLAVMMSGSHFVGAEEARRRSRYAVVSALGELDYAPMDNEHIGYVMVSLAERQGGGEPASRHASMRMPFEAFKSATDPPAGASGSRALPRNVLVLWVDDVALNAPGSQGEWVQRLRKLLALLGLSPCVDQTASASAASSADCFVRIIGPASSDEYGSLAAATGRQDGGQALPRLPPLVSPYVTSDVQFNQAVSAGIKREGLTIIPAVASDATVLQGIVRELRARNMPLCQRTENQRSILLFGEWDTEYGRRAQRTLTNALEEHPSEGHPIEKCSQKEVHPRVVSYSFVRGLDGVAVGSQGTSATKTEPAGGSAPVSATAASGQIEWPESSDERDYLRRLGQRLQQLPDVNRTLAIGLFATDAHDKLLLLQALRDRFPGILFFTTDLDARLAHPLVRKWTRNLIVGSSFGLTLRRDVQVHTPPFRDSYQTAAFLATLAALQLPMHNGNSLLNAKLQEWLEHPALFEVGRTRVVPLLDRFDEDTSAAAKGRTVQCGPRTLEACDTIQPQHVARHLGYRWPLGLILLFLGLAAAMLLWALQSQSFGALMGKAGAPAPPDRGRARGYPHSTTVVLSRVCLLGLILSLGLLAYLCARALVPEWTILPIEPRLLMEGISSWPVAFCWSFALALTFMYLLKLFLTVQVRFNATEDRYLCGGTEASSNVGRLLGYWEWLWTTLVRPRAEAIVGQAKRKPFADTWATYRYNAQGWARVRRIAIFWIVLFLAPLALVHGSDLAPTYAVRGGLRGYVWFLNWADFIMLTMLMAAVADAVLLCTIFVVDLGKQRNSYPPSVLDETALRLGLCSGLRDQLDEYIDTCVVGDRTAAVAEYLYYPFVVLAVLAVSMTNVFDNWAFDWTRVGLYAFYGAVLGLLWLALHHAAIHARRLALAEMDIIWFKLQVAPNTAECSAKAMRSQFERIMEQVRNSKTGAYGPLLRQPIFRALLWPLSGVSTAQLVGYFL